MLNMSNTHKKYERNMRTTTKVQFYKNEKVSFQDLENEQLSEGYKQQIEVETSNETIINKEKIRELKKTITYLDLPNHTKEEQEEKKGMF